MSSVNTQFSIAVHLLSGIGSRSGLVTSEELARSVNTNPAFVKRILAKLARADLIRTTPGRAGGCELSRPATKISLFDVYAAVEAPRAFAIHDYPVTKCCFVSGNIRRVLGGVLSDAQASLERELKKKSIATMIRGLRE